MKPVARWLERISARRLANATGQGLPVAGQQPIPMTLQQRGLEALDQPGQRDHSTVPQVSAKRSISALMRVLH